MATTHAGKATKLQQSIPTKRLTAATYRRKGACKRTSCRGNRSLGRHSLFMDVLAHGSKAAQQRGHLLTEVCQIGMQRSAHAEAQGARGGALAEARSCTGG
eukprot:1152429-Pelagomonas_calceolata.AAC.2